MTDNNFFKDILDDYMYDFNEEAYKEVWREYGREKFEEVKEENIQKINKIKRAIELGNDRENRFYFSSLKDNAVLDLDNDTILKATDATVTFQDVEDMEEIERKIRELNTKLRDMGPEYKDNYYYKEYEKEVFNLEYDILDKYKVYQNNKNDIIIIEELENDLKKINSNNDINYVVKLEKFKEKLDEKLEKIKSNPSNYPYVFSDLKEIREELENIKITPNDNNINNELELFENKLKERKVEINNGNIKELKEVKNGMEKLSLHIFQEDGHNYPRIAKDNDGNDIYYNILFRGNDVLLLCGNNDRVRLDYENFLPYIFFDVIDDISNNTNDSIYLRRDTGGFNLNIAEIVLGYCRNRYRQLFSAEDIIKYIVKHGFEEKSERVKGLLIETFCRIGDTEMALYFLNNPDYYDTFLNISDRIIGFACYSGNSDFFNRIKSALKDKNENPEISFEALKEACVGKRPEMVKYLLDNNYLDNFDNNNIIQLFEIIIDPVTAKIVLDELIRRGGDVNTQNMLKETPLSYAVSQRNLKLVKFLLTRPEIDIYKKGRHRETLTSYAVANNSIEILKVLLKKQKEVRETTNDMTLEKGYNNEAFTTAIVGGGKKMFNILLRDGNINLEAVNNLKETLPIFIIKHERIDFLENLLDKMYKELSKDKLFKIINMADKDGVTFVNYLIREKNFNLIKFLLDKNLIDINMRVTSNSFSRYPGILRTDMRGDYYPNRTIFEKVKDIKDKNKTFLHCAVEYYDAEIVRLLLNQDGIDINMEDNLGRTPLSIILDRYNVTEDDLYLKNAEKIKLNLLEKNGIDAPIEEILKVRRLEKQELRYFRRDEEEIVRTMAIKNKEDTEMIKLFLQKAELKIKSEEIEKIREKFKNNEEIMGLLNKHQSKQMSMANISMENKNNLNDLETLSDINTENLEEKKIYSRKK